MEHIGRRSIDRQQFNDYVRKTMSRGDGGVVGAGDHPISALGHQRMHSMGVK
jgi:hypothetical protein